MVPPVGPCPARIMIVGEAPGQDEVYRMQPFVGASGQELDRMLHEAGIARSQCFVTNVVRVRPPGNDISVFIPDKKSAATPEMGVFRGRAVAPCVLEGIELLRHEISRVQPNIIIAFGNVSLWALTGNWGITDWRGSLLVCDLTGEASPPKVVATFHPSGILRNWAWRASAVQDLRRAKREEGDRVVIRPKYDFIIRPNFDQVFSVISTLLEQAHAGPLKLAVDIETRSGHIACLGFAWNKLEALCIPFMCTERKEGYWLEDEEVEILAILQELLCHPNVEVIGQNFIYDTQYIWRHFRFVPRFKRDTMIAHHTMFPGTLKALDYLSSLYCEHHLYWKDDGKEWHKKLGEDQLWVYNCTDCVRTYEIDENEQTAVDSMGKREVHDFQQDLFWPVLKMMIKGVRIDLQNRSKLAMELSDELASREQWVIDVLGHPLNLRSPKQMKALFYEDLAQKPIINRKTGAVTLNDEAIQRIAAKEPILRPLVRVISEYRSIGVFLSTFVNASLDRDSRLRCSFSVAGTETFRFSSSGDAFGSGTNLQNIPKGTEDPGPEDLVLPNIRKLFVPDHGYTFFDQDLDRADLQVVVWEANDELLKLALRAGTDLHLLNAGTLFGIRDLNTDSLSSPEFVKDAKVRYGKQRQLAKSWVHGTNYGGGPRTMAIAAGITVKEAERLQNVWFYEHPGIKKWHERTEAGLRLHRSVKNAFGYTRHYFDRVEGLLPEALAWIPQSTVACIINRVLARIDAEVPEVEVLLQVHDSLAGQFPTHLSDYCVRRIREVAGSVVVPYPEPLTIPCGIKTSPISWGDCK